MVGDRNECGSQWADGDKVLILAIEDSCVHTTNAIYKLRKARISGSLDFVNSTAPCYKVQITYIIYSLVYSQDIRFRIMTERGTFYH